MRRENGISYDDGHVLMIDFATLKPTTLRALQAYLRTDTADEESEATTLTPSPALPSQPSPPVTTSPADSQGQEAKETKLHSSYFLREWIIGTPERIPASEREDIILGNTLEGTLPDYVQLENADERLASTALPLAYPSPPDTSPPATEPLWQNEKEALSLTIRALSKAHFTPNMMEMAIFYEGVND